MKDYSFYLFCKLRDIILPTDKPYDIQYEEDIELFEKYDKSKFNDFQQGEYECMQNFLYNEQI